MSSRRPHRTRAFRPRLDRLEARDVPATITVDTSGDPLVEGGGPVPTFAPDDGRVSLREAVEAINRGADVGDVAADVTEPYGTNDRIVFTADVVDPIVVDPGPDNGDFNLSRAVRVDGGGGAGGRVTVSGGLRTRVFDLTGDVRYVLANLAVVDGRVAGDGAGVRTTAGSLTAEGVRFQNNATLPTPPAPDARPTAGGAVHSTGGLTLGGCVFVSNSAAGTATGRGEGGAVWAVSADIAGCTFAGNTADNGGAVRLLSAGTVSGSTFGGNNRAVDGGALHLGAPPFRGGVFAVLDSTVTDNLATGGGGGIFLAASAAATAVVLSGSAVEGNVAGAGGGLFSPGNGAVTAADTRFVGNRAADRGGGLAVTGGRVSLTGGEVSDKTVTGQNGVGGGVSADGGAAVTLTGLAVVGNTAGGDGGGLHLDAAADSAVDRVLFADNAARFAGGAVLARGGAGGVLRVTNATFAGNSAVTGGAVAAVSPGAGPVVQLDFVTVADNTAGGDDGIVGVGDAPLVVTSSVVADPVRGELAGSGNNVFRVSAGGSGYAASDALDVDPRLGPLAPAPGFPGNRAFGLLAGSPAAGRGDPAAAPPTDQRGLPRPAGGLTDAGAFQLQRPAVGSPQAAGRFVAYGTGAGVRARVRVARPGQDDLTLLPFEDSFLGGVRVAVADLNLDGTDDIAVTTGPGGGPRVMVFSGSDGEQIANFFAFEPSFRGGAHVAAADTVTTVDGRRVRTSLLVVGAGSFTVQPGSPRVRAFRDFEGLPDADAVGTAPVDFFAYDERFQGGVRVAAADLAGDGTFDIVTVPGPSGGPVVRVWDADDLTGPAPALQQELAGLGAAGEGHRGGAFVAASGGAVVVTPDSLQDFPGTELEARAGGLADPAGVAPPPVVVTAASTSRPPEVSVFAPAGGGRLATTPEVIDLADPTFRGGVRVAAGVRVPAADEELTGSAGAGVLAVGYGPGGRGRVRLFAFDPADVVPLELDAGAAGLGDLGPDASVYVGLAPAPGAGPA